MRLESRKYLYDIEEAAALAAQFTRGRNFQARRRSYLTASLSRNRLPAVVIVIVVEFLSGAKLGWRLAPSTNWPLFQCGVSEISLSSIHKKAGPRSPGPSSMGPKALASG